VRFRTPINHYLQASLVLALATCLVLLCWPRLRASFGYLPVDTSIALHWSGESLRQHGHYRYYDGLGTLHYLRWLDSALPAEERLAALAASATATREVVALAPMKPRAWLRLAAAESVSGEHGEETAAAFKMSAWTGRIEPPMMLLRLELGFAHRRWLDAEGLRLLRDQTILSWNLQRQALISRFRSGAIDYSRVAALLALSHPDILIEMEEALEPPVL
jgi:hypothetical protein